RIVVEQAGVRAVRYPRGAIRCGDHVVGESEGGPRVEVRAVGVEHLATLGSAARYVRASVAVGIDSVDAAELTGPVALRSPLLEEAAVLVEFHDPRVAQAVGDEH